jgi:hypothetical protein
VKPTTDAAIQRERDLSRGIAQLISDIRKTFPSLLLGRDRDGRMTGAAGNLSTSGPARLVFRRDAKGRIVDIVRVPIVDPIERAAWQLWAQHDASIRAIAGPAAAVTIPEATFASFPRETNLEAIRATFERVAWEAT